jgi:hypothetical protein
MSDDGTGKTNGTALDTGKWTTEGSTAGGGTATYQSEKLEFKTGNEGGYAGTSRTSRSFNVTSPTDVEVSGTFFHDTNEAYPIVMVRGTTSGVDFSNGYYLGLFKGSSVEIGKVVSYSGTGLGSASKTISSSTTYGFRFQVIGDALKARVWTGTEPGTWDIETTDSTFTSAGKAGITIGAGNAAVNHVVTFDDILVTDGSSGAVDKSGAETLTLVDAATVLAPVSGAETLTLTDAASLSSPVSGSDEGVTLVDAASLEAYQLHHELKVYAEFTPDVWTDLSDRVVGETEAQATFGRPTRFDDVASSTFRVTLRNSDGALTVGNPNSPYYPNVDKGIGIRASIVWAGQEYAMFDGSAVDLDMPALTSADDAVVTIQCADVMATLERKVLLSPFVEEARRVAKYAVTDGWCDVFAFPPSSVKTEASVQVADTSFDNKGVLKSGGTSLGSCIVVPAANGAGVCRSSGVEGNGGALTEGTLDFEVGDNGSGRQTHPILKFVPQTGFGQFELLFKVPKDVLPPIYATGTHTVTSGQSWNTIRDLYGNTFDELRLLNPELPGLSALAVDQVVNINNDGKAGSEWVVAQFFAGSTEMMRICLTNNNGVLALIIRNPSGGAGYIWNGSTLADEKWRKLTVYKSGTDQVRSNINDSSTGQTMTGLPADLADVTTVYIGGRVASASAGAGGQTQCPEFSVGGVAFHKQSGVWSYYVLDAPPANITARQRLVELGQYASPVQVTVGTVHNSTISDPFTTLVTRTDITGRSVLDCMQELARTVGAYLWVDPGTGSLTMRRGPTEPLGFMEIDLVADADDSNPPRWRNTVDSESTRVTAKCPAGEVTSINEAAESKGLYRATDVETCAATVAAAKSVADRYVGSSGTLHLTNLQIDMVHAEKSFWGPVLTSLLPSETGIKATSTVPDVTGFDTIEAIVEAWTFTSTISSATVAFETTPIRAYNSPVLPGFAVTASTGTQVDGTVTVQRPSGTSAGDYLVAIATTDETGTLAGLKVGGSDEWTEQGSGATSDAGVGRVWTRIAGSDEPSAYTVTVDGENGSQALMSDDLSGTNGTTVDTAKWTAGEVRTGAGFTHQDGYGLMNPGTNTGYDGRVIYRVNTPDVADVDVAWSFYFGDGDSFHWVMVRADSNVGGELIEGYEIRPSVGDDFVRVLAITNFTLTEDYGSIPMTMSAGTWYRCRVQIVGSTLKVKVWVAASPEPSAWGMTRTTTVFTSAGQIGFACGGGNTAAARIRIDDVEVTSPSTVQSGWPETHVTVMRVSGVDTSAPIVAAPVWSDDDTTTGDHVAPTATLGDDGLRISHWHIVSDGDPVSGGDTGGGTASGFSFGMSGFGQLTETGGSTELTNANNWLTNKSLKAVGHWQDSDATVQQEQWGIGSGERFGGWNGIIDIAFGGVFGTETWAQAAAGTFDTRWQTGLDAIATKWGTRDESLLHLRFAHEFNGDFSDWAVTDSGDMSYTNFVAAWIRWANLVRATLPDAQIVWSPNDGTSSLAHVDDAYPGSAYVDVIGPDTYNAWPHVTNAAEWTSKINLGTAADPEGIEMWRQYAEGKGKPLCIPEWGNPAVDNGGAGGGDDAYWAEQMLAWCKANGGSGAGQVKYAVYFNIGTAGGYTSDYLIYAGASGEYGTVNQPSVAAAIRADA